MNDEQRTAAVTPDSAAHKKLEKLDRRDRMVRIIEVGILMLTLVFNIFIAIKSVQNQQTIQTNQRVNIAKIAAANKMSSAELQEAANKNRARADVQLCITSVSPSVRQPEYVKSCYDQVEKLYGVQIQRYGDGRE